MTEADTQPKKSFMATMMETRFKKWTMILTMVGALGATMVTVEALFGVAIRPAWSYEVQRVETISSKQHLELSIRLYQNERREIRRDLGERQTNKAEYIRNGVDVPTWLDNDISNLEESIDAINNSISTDTEKLLKLE